MIAVRRWIGLAVLCAVALMPVKAAPSVVINADSTVSFEYCGCGKKVKLQGDFHFKGEKETIYSDHDRKVKMVRAEGDSCFRTTIKPLLPEYYTYCFRVDGKRIPDPANPDTAWQKVHKYSVLPIGGSELADWYMPVPQEGKMHYLTWYSSQENIYRRVHVYTPLAYETSDEPMDMLVLIHGINGYEGAWTERGRAIQIMENLVAAGKCRPMILVMPDVNVDPREDRPSHHTLWTNIMNYSRLKRDHRIEHALRELIPVMDSTFRTSNRIAIAGLSDGARMAANLAQTLPDRAYAVGLFSPVINKKQMPADSVMAGCPDDPCVYYAIYVGKKDWMFIPKGRSFHKRMTKASMPHTYEELAEGHYWRTWREALIYFLEKL